MSERTWTIVLFEEDNSVEAVPSTWIQGQNCLWPTYSQDKLKTAIKKHEPLNTCWPKYKIRSFRNSTFGDYSTARAKARTAEVTSDLNSEIEVENVKRKRIQKILSSSSSDESFGMSVALPMPPKLNKKRNTEKENVQEHSTSSDLLVNESTPLNTDNTNTMHTGNNISFDNGTASVSIPCNSTCSCCYKKFNEKIPNTILTQHYMIRSAVTEVLSEIKDIKLQLKNITQHSNTTEKEKIISIFSRNDLQFPLSTEEDLRKLEQILEDDNEMTNAINELTQLGGNNIYEFIRRTLSMMLTNDVANKYSFYGRKTKKAFCHLNICKLLISGARKGEYCSTAKEVETCIQGWLRRAADRGKLR